MFSVQFSLSLEKSSLSSVMRCEIPYPSLVILYIYFLHIRGGGCGGKET